MPGKKAVKVKAGDVLADGHSVASLRHHFPKAGQATFVLEDGRILSCDLDYLLDVRSGPREAESMAGSRQSEDATLID